MEQAAESAVLSARPPGEVASVLAVIPCVLTGIADSTEQPIRRALHATAFTVKHVGVDHRRPHVTMPEQLLDRANVVARFQKMRGEAVAQRVRPHRLRDADAASCFADGTLRHRLVQVMPALLARARVGRDGRGGKDPLPTPLAVRVWVFTRQGIGKHDASEPCRQVGRVELADRSRCAFSRETTADGSIVPRSLSPFPSRPSDLHR